MLKIQVNSNQNKGANLQQNSNGLKSRRPSIRSIISCISCGGGKMLVDFGVYCLSVTYIWNFMALKIQPSPPPSPN